MSREPRSIVDQLVDYGGTSRRAFAAVVACLLVLLAVLAVVSLGALEVRQREVWKLGLEPTIVVYIVGTYPLLQRRWRAAIDALRPLSCRPEFVDEALAKNRRGEWLALLTGAAFSIWVTSSWQFEGPWARLYLVGANVVMFGLMALSIFDGLTRTQGLKRVVHAGLELDVFDRRLLTPLANWGQTVALTFVGGICLSLVFQSYETLHTLQSLVIYSILVVVATTLSFTSVWSIHDALVSAQRREMAAVHQHWLNARSELKKGLVDGRQGDISRLYEPMVVLGAYERQLLAESTWPFNQKIVKELIASLIAPFLIYGLKIALGLSGTS